MKVNSGIPSGSWPNSLDDTGWQWQPTRTAHDPSPPIILEDPGAFTQYSGLRVHHGGSNLELCLVATADAPAGMGGQVRVRKGGVTYAAYLVETTDPDASPVRVETSLGVKSIRLKT